MINLVKKLFSSLIVSTLLLASSSDLVAYTKKAPYAGYGKPSKVNGQIKTKHVTGHVKKTSKGYTYVNPYSRSK